MIREIIPMIDSTFRTVADREHRAMAGLSMGGNQTCQVTVHNLDKFAWIGSYSAYLTPEVFDKYFSRVSAKPEVTNQQLKLLWLGVGREDFLNQSAIAFMDLLKERKIERKTLITDGGHTWLNARHYLTETLQLYFQ